MTRPFTERGHVARRSPAVRDGSSALPAFVEGASMTKEKGMGEGKDAAELAPHQMRWLAAMEAVEPGGRLLVLGPRSHGLTTTALAFVDRSLKRDPSARVLYVANHQTNAERLAARILAQHPTASVAAHWLRPEPPALADDAAFDVLVFDGQPAGLATAEPDDIQRAYDIIERVASSGVVLAVGSRRHRSDLFGEFVIDRLFRVVTTPAILRWPARCEPIYEVKGGRRRLVDFEIEGRAEVLWPERWPFARPTEQGESLMSKRFGAKDAGLSPGCFLSEMQGDTSVPAP